LNKVSDVHVFAGRGPYRELTRFINEQIFSELALRPSDRLVDIGCGDGTLLKLALQSGVTTGIGLNSTKEEVSGLCSIGLDVRQGLSDAVPLPDGFASVVVCNCVLLIIPQTKIAASLREIARIAEPNARVWIGEIPRAQEPPNTPLHETIPEMLWYMLRKRGIRMFLGMCRRLLTGAQRGPVLVNPLAAVFWAEPEKFVQMALEAGLKCERHFPHQMLDKDRKPCLHPTRHNYLFTRESV
jgi:ubiquinone/menaquinone biosynthesis C-methylase UbiE